MPEILIYKNAYLVDAPSDAHYEEDRHEENLHLNGPSTLDRIRRMPQVPPNLRAHLILLPGVAHMVFCLPSVAVFYGLDRTELLEAWVTHYGENAAFEKVINSLSSPTE